MHVLNLIHNNPIYAEICRAISPHGLVALALSLPPTTSWNSSLISELEDYDPEMMRLLTVEQLNQLQIFCDEIADDVDAHLATMFRAYRCVSSPLFFNWESLSILSALGTTNEADYHVLQKWSYQRAKTFRNYHGPNALPWGLIAGGVFF